MATVTKPMLLDETGQEIVSAINGLSNTLGNKTYAESSTAAATAAKEAAITGFKLLTGTSVFIKFANANTAANPTLNVSSTGAKAIYSDGAAFTNLEAGKIYEFVYDGTYYQLVSGSTPNYVDAQYNNSTTYSKGMTCISGNVRYRYINSTASSGHTPPNSTYWEVLSVASEIHNSVDFITRLLTPTQDTTVSFSLEGANMNMIFKKYQFNLAVNQTSIIPLGSALLCNILPISFYIVKNNNTITTLSFDETIRQGMIKYLRDDENGTLTGMAYQYYLEVTQKSTSATVPVTVMLWYMKFA